jgi:heptosyltransferase-2
LETRATRVVAIAPGWLGDAVLSLPAMHALGTLGALTILAHPRVAPLYGMGFGDCVRAFEPRIASPRALRESSALRVLAPSIAVVFPRSFSSALRAFLIGARERIGIDDEARGALLTRRVRIPWPARSRHLFEEFAAIAAAAGATLPDAAPRIAISAEARERAWRLLESRGARRGERFVALSPGAAFGPAKRWPAERFAELGARVASNGAGVVLVGGAADRPVTEEVARRIAAPRIAAPVDLTGATDIPMLAAILSIASVAVVNDSGPMHVAAAAGTPVVALFGSTNPDWTRPLDDRAVALRYPVPCSPCYRRECPIGLQCFDGISVDRAFRAVEARLA